MAYQIHRLKNKVYLRTLFIGLKMTKQVTFKVDTQENLLNIIKKPTETDYEYWIYEEDPKIAKINPNPEWKGGKWMMFFDYKEIDEKWEHVVNLYRQGTVG